MEATRRAKTEKFATSLVKLKVLLIVFFDCNGVMHQEFLPQDRVVNKEYYLKVMRRLREAMRQKPTELWKNQF